MKDKYMSDEEIDWISLSSFDFSKTWFWDPAFSFPFSLS